MLRVTEPPQDARENEGDDGCMASAKFTAVLFFADLAVDQALERRCHESENKERKQNRLEDKDDVPGEPAVVERHERTHAVVVGEVEEDVAEAAEQREGVKHGPADGNRRNLAAFQSPTMD